jgi:N-acetyl-D-muramate 6-phosphate phosphatase
MPLQKPRAILFDLDGTLADTAPDLAGALNRLRAARGLEPAAYDKLRPFASAGARGLIGAAFGLKPGDHEYEELRVAFLAQYESAIAAETTLFDGIAEVLGGLHRQSLPWGIVTNKPSRYTNLLLPLIGLEHAICVISGDTTPHPKPHPAPLFEAAMRIGIPAEQCWYVGDDLRDIQAGKAAGMGTVAAAWGYCGEEGPVAWGADVQLTSPLALLDLVQEAA